MLSLPELQIVQKIIYDPMSPKEQRREAESRLDQFQKLDGSWHIHIQYLQTPQVDDSLLFLLCIGLDRIIWRVWSTLSTTDQEGIINTIIQILVTRFATLPSFVRSKIEQILATICKNNVSFNILFQLTQYCEQSSLSPLIGISAFRTVLDEVLGNDMRVASDRKSVLTKIASDISSQLLNMACNLCVQNIQNGSGDCESLLTSLALIKVIVSKIPVGQHINTATLYLLYSIAELSATSPSYKTTSLSAVEALTELMSKRYIPTHTSLASTPVDYSPSTAGRNASVAVLIEMVAKAVNLIKLYWYECLCYSSLFYCL